MIDEKGAGEARVAYLTAHADEAKAAYEKEMLRRERKAAKAGAEEDVDVPDQDVEGD